MRILFSTTAGAGHFAPVIPFARACVGAGHEVRVAAPESFARTVSEAGFVHVPFDDASPADLGAVFSQLDLGTMSEANARVLREVFGRLNPTSALPRLRVFVDEWGPQVIVSETAEFGSVLVAEERGIPQLHVNIGLDSFTERVLDEVDEPLRELGCAAGSERLRSAPRLTLLPSSFDRQGGPAAVHRFRDSPVTLPKDTLPATWWPQEARERPLVYVTFGSIAGGQGFFPDFYGRVLAALSAVPARVLMTLGAGLDPAELGGLPANAHVESWWPQAGVLREASVVVAHGGFGTLAATLAQGLPQVIVPLLSGDQYANAARVAELGIGISLSPGDPASLRTTDVVPGGPELSALAGAVNRALTDPDLAQAARQVAADLAALPPAEEAAALIAS